MKKKIIVLIIILLAILSIITFAASSGIYEKYPDIDNTLWRKFYVYNSLIKQASGHSESVEATLVVEKVRNEIPLSDAESTLYEEVYTETFPTHDLQSEKVTVEFSASGTIVSQTPCCTSNC